MYRILFLLFLLTACQTDEAVEAERLRLLREASAWLWEQQADDGGWHSEVHGILKGGQAWTPYIYDALLAVPESTYRPSSAQLERALAFMINNLDSLGVMGRSQSLVLEYPVYATAYTALALAHTPVAASPVLFERTQS
ncbi:MAG: hypothetical protein KDC54_19910, partial [Lewinella sp.]|nr:hypothetical protein [Lewinella sp.]